MPEQLAFPWTSTLTTRELLLQLPDVGPWRASDHEREALDFKETPATTPTPDHAKKKADERFRTDLVETAVGFANSRGGTIVIGVRDSVDEGESVVAGVDLDDWQPDATSANGRVYLWTFTSALCCSSASRAGPRSTAPRKASSSIAKGTAMSRSTRRRCELCGLPEDDTTGLPRRCLPGRMPYLGRP